MKSDPRVRFARLALRIINKLGREDSVRLTRALLYEMAHMGESWTPAERENKRFRHALSELRSMKPPLAESVNILDEMTDLVSTSGLAGAGVWADILRDGEWRIGA